MNPQIEALYTLQKQDRRLTELETQLRAIPTRLEELDSDLGKLETLVDTERRKVDDTRAFKASQESQLADEDELIKNTRTKMNQVHTPRELNALQREADSTRRMAQTRTQEIQKLQEAIDETEARINSMVTTLAELRARASSEREKLISAQGKIETKVGKLRVSRESLTSKVETDTLRQYDRIRKRWGGVAFVPAAGERCTACKMMVPHQMYVRLLRGEEVLPCENCGRLLYWEGLFSDEKDENAPKAAPKKRAPGAEADADG